MSIAKSSLSAAQSYEEIGAFWDRQDLSAFWEQTEPVEFQVEVRSDITYFAIEARLSERLRVVAEQQGISAETLLNLWVQEKTAEATAAK